MQIEINLLNWNLYPVENKENIHYTVNFQSVKTKFTMNKSVM